MRVVITNSVSLNVGDAAISEGIVKMVRAVYGSDTEITVLDSAASASARYYPQTRFEPIYLLPFPTAGKPFSRLRQCIHRAVRLIATKLPGSRRLLGATALAKNLTVIERADLVISAGGTYLVEHYGDGIARRLDHLAMAMDMGKPVVLYTQSLGPFASPGNRDAISRTVSRADLVLLRDARSRDNLIDVGVPPDRLRVVADAAFFLADPENLRAQAGRSFRAAPHIAISVREWSYFQSGNSSDKMRTYQQAICAAITTMVRDHGARITFLSTCQGIPEYRFDDSAAATAMAAMLPPDVAPHVDIDSAFHSPEALMARIADFDFVIATRMHMAILALSSGTPVLPIAYEFKTTELFKNIGMDRWITDIEAIEPAKFASLVPAFTAALPELWPKVASEVLGQYESAASVSADLAGIRIR